MNPAARVRLWLRRARAAHRRCIHGVKLSEPCLECFAMTLEENKDTPPGQIVPVDRKMK